MTRSLACAAAALLTFAACGDAATTTTTVPSVTTVVSAPTTTTTAPPPATSATAATTTTAAAVPAVEPEAIELASDEAGYRITASVPQLTGWEDGAVERRVNQRIRDEVQAKVDLYQEAFEGVAPSDDLPPSEAGISFETTLLNDRVLSLLFSEYFFQRGTARPDELAWSLLFNLETGEEYTLPELLSADSAPFALLELTERRLIEEVWGGDADALRSYVDIQAEFLFGAWSLTETTWDVSYGRFEVAPGEVGPVTVSIPYEELGVTINPDGPIADLVGAG